MSEEKIRLGLGNIENKWQNENPKLVKAVQGWRFVIPKAYYTQLLHLRVEKKPKYSTAGMETLATIAYRQPITRAKIGQIRGVSVSNKILCLLQEREWIKIAGYEEIIGRPALYVTTQCSMSLPSVFLQDFCLLHLEDLPDFKRYQRMIDKRI